MVATRSAGSTSSPCRSDWLLESSGAGYDRLKGLGFRVQGLGFRGLGFRGLEGLGV